MKKILILISSLMISLMTYSQMELPIDPNVRYGKLENGLTYYVRHNPQPENRADFYIAQKVGSMQEEDNQAGLAHFLEHIAFAGTKHFPGRQTMLSYLETIGAKFGANVNAYTSFDETVYNLSNIPLTRETIIDSCLLVLHDWSAYIDLKDDAVDKERLIIKEEWRTRGNAQLRLWEKQLPVLFKDSKYANRLPIGNMDVVENFEYQTLRDYYHKWYRPDLQAIIVVGDIDAELVEQKIKERFSSIPMPADAAERVYFPVADNDEPLVTVETDKEATNTTVLLFLKHEIIPEQLNKTEIGLAISISKSLAAAMMSERLSEISQQSDGPFAFAYAYDTDFFVSKTKDAWTSYAVSKEGKTAESLAVLARETERMRQFGFTESELERAKANLLKNYENSFNNRKKQLNSSYVREYISSFTDNEPIPGIEYEYEYVKRTLPMMPVEQINQIMLSLLPKNNVAICISGPEKEGLVYPTNQEIADLYKTVVAEKIEGYAEETIDEPLISTLPQAGKIVKEEKDASLDATIWTLSNGMKVAFKTTKFKDDEIRMNGYSYGGTSLVADEDVFNAQMVSGLSTLTGLGNFSAVDLKKVLAGKTANASLYADKAGQTLVGGSSIKDIETMMQLAYLQFTAIRGDEEVFQNRMNFIKGQIANRKNNPSSSLGDSINFAMYPNNPRKKIMQPEDIDNISQAKVISLHKQFVANPASFVFTFVGNVDAENLKPLVEQYLASLPSGNKDAKYIERDETPRKGAYKNQFAREMTTPKTTSFSLYSGQIDRNLENTIYISALKQLMDIVYTRTVREEQGGTYGVGTAASISRVLPANYASIQMNYDTNPDEIGTIAPIIGAEINRIATEGPTAIDFQKIKEYMIKKHQEDLETNNYWLNVMNDKFFYGEDNHTKTMDVIRNMKADDIKAITAKLLNQKNLIEVIMTPIGK